jgi:hypothetical protein
VSYDDTIATLESQVDSRYNESLNTADHDPSCDEFVEINAAARAILRRMEKTLAMD